MIKFGSPGFFLIPVNGRDTTMNDANIEMNCIYIDSISGIPTSFTPATPPTWSNENTIALSLTAEEMEHDRFIISTINNATEASALATTITNIETFIETDLSPLSTAVEVVDGNVDSLITTAGLIKTRTDKIPNTPAAIGSQMSLSSAGLLGVSGVVDSALETYDGIKRSEATADKDEIKLQISGLTVPDNAKIAAIKLKTDNLPSSPAAVGSQMAINSTGLSSINTLLTNYDAPTRAEATSDKNEIKNAISGLLAPDNASIASIKAKTDNLPALPAATGDIVAGLTSYGVSKEITLSAAQSSLSQLSQSIKDKVDLLYNTDLSDVATSLEVTAVMEALETVDGLVDDIKTKVLTLNNTDISSLATADSLADVAGEVTTINGNTSDIGTTLTSLQEITETLDTSVVTVSNTISTLTETSTDLEGLVDTISSTLIGLDNNFTALVNVVRTMESEPRIILTPVNMETGEITIVKGSSYGMGSGEPAILWSADGVPDLTLNEITVVIGAYQFPATPIGPGSILLQLTSEETGYLKSANAQVKVKVDANNYNLYPMGFIRVVTL